MGFLVKLKGRTEEEIDIFLDIAVENIIEGKILAFPTNSVYGIGCDPTNLNAIERIYNIKFRDKSKGLLLLVSDISEAKKNSRIQRIILKISRSFLAWTIDLNFKEKRTQHYTLGGNSF